MNLGATAIGTGLNTPPEYSGLAISVWLRSPVVPYVPAEDLIEATSDRSAYVMLHGAVKRLAMKLPRSVTTCVCFSGPRTALQRDQPAGNAGWLHHAGQGQPGHSGSGQPASCFKVFGNDVTITFAAEAGQLQLNVMEPVIGQAMFESLSLMEKPASPLREKCVKASPPTRTSA